MPWNACSYLSAWRSRNRHNRLFGRSILVIIWQLLSHPGLRYHDLGADYHTRRIDTERRTRNHVRQLEALGYTVTLTAAA